MTHRVSTLSSGSVSPSAPLKAISIQAPQAERVYFLPSTIQSVQGQAAQAAVPCRLARVNARALIYVDQRIPRDPALIDLVDAIDSASMSKIIDAVERLVGTVADVDRDGHMTIVVTPDVGRLGQPQNPVYGITRPSDFIRGVDRPLGNNSDVIFLNSSLPIGKALDAVLCHEWCHAAVFSRRFENADPEADGHFDDDWLNEAIAHIVEVASSGSDSNISNRVQSYWAQPARSPLVVRDFCSPAYWRNERVRGAGYLFLDWYLKQSDDDGLTRLLGMPSLDVSGLEAASHRGFDELFRSWTVSLGEQLAGEIRDQNANSASAPRMTHHQWKLDAGEEQSLTVRVDGSCADFVHIECPSGSAWRLIATTSASAQIQATLVPVSDP